MQQYNLRPVSELSRSPSSRSSASPQSHNMSPPSSHLPPIQHSTNSTAQPSSLRRPISPSSLPHLDVSNGQAMPPRIYPPPPTGHELMRLFPHNHPTNPFSSNREHQFFAQAGKEIIRVRVESDFPPTPSGPRTTKGKEPVSVQHPWPAHSHPPPPPVTVPPQPQPTMQPPPEHGSHAPTHMHSPPHPIPPYPHHHPDISRGAPGSGAVAAAAAAVAAPPPPPPPGYAPSHHPATIVRNAPPPVDHRVDDIREEDDQSWRRPTPHGERRRAGKHTRRVVVK
ncbi:hypothetical protein B0F90DRAFT_1736515 [Multifurca ochricompacta]|uniref:Uncharacterized protein n=1 Tax=Multifurca ochricompacta TaxID=376703 RepID=A0AAD4M330_9AGAM|nr:hypothetical protein B0F90DRAFT_1736515 [Multifurca ochricompacta]